MHSRALSIPEESWPKILALYLKDGAKITYTKIINKYPNLNEDFYGLIQEMDQEFINSGGVVPSFDLNSRKKLDTESVGKFYSTICAMAKRAYPNIDEHARDQIILAQFIKGLPITFQRGMLNNSHITSLMKHSRLPKDMSTPINCYYRMLLTKQLSTRLRVIERKTRRLSHSKEV
ncbi:hypothetical protein EB796_008549 [Bugula neritina]|uniref:Uncharacterized protein n=1 Tax=Bugula neritina TaxID=10212 RepID=A0A7J7K3C4_BUGNE|nr:hypothetical protein EB796_008549 [Bugula neritina]